MSGNPRHIRLHNRESSALQYAMRDRLTSLGCGAATLAFDLEG